jgi:hypothetical protein
VTVQEVKLAVTACRSWACVIRRLGLPVGGASYGTVQTFCRDNNINTDHFRGQGWRKGKTGVRK